MAQYRTRATLSTRVDPNSRIGRSARCPSSSGPKWLTTTPASFPPAGFGRIPGNQVQLSGASTATSRKRLNTLVAISNGDQSGKNLPHGMELIYERRHHAKIPTSAAQGPEQIGMKIFAGQ